MTLFIIAGIVALTVIAFIILLSHEQNDKDRRRRQGLPPKKYHDITDEDITVIETIRHVKRHE